MNDFSLKKKYVLSTLIDNKKYDSDKIYEISSFIDDLYSCFGKRQILKDKTFGTREEMTEWSNMTFPLAAWKYIIISREELKNLLSIYLSNKMFWCKELDWLFTNSLLFAETIATEEHMCIKSSLIWYSIISATSKDFPIKYILFCLLKSLFKLGCKIIIVLISYNISPYLMWAFIVYSIVRFIFLKINSHKETNTIIEMWGTYSFVKNPNFNWRVLRDKMDIDRRNFRIRWDDELYNLVDLRIY